MDAGATARARRRGCLAVRGVVQVGGKLRGRRLVRARRARRPLAEIWNGKRWTPARPPASGGGLAITGLDAVSCASPARCAATGVSAGGPPLAVVESWNGRAWSMRKGAAVPGDIGAVQTGVSCPSAGSCAAVGFGMYSTATVSFSEIWNGKNWRDAAVPLPGGGTSSSHLWGISCATVNRCVAVGDTELYVKGVNTESRPR